MSQVKVEIEAPAKDVRLVRPLGAIDSDSFEIFEDALNQVRKEGILKILLDMRKVPRIASVGIGVLISCRTELLELGGALILIRPSEEVMNIFDVMDYRNIFGIVETPEEGMRALTRKK